MHPEMLRIQTTRCTERCVGGKGGHKHRPPTPDLPALDSHLCKYCYFCYLSTPPIEKFNEQLKNKYITSMDSNQYIYVRNIVDTFMCET